MLKLPKQFLNTDFLHLYKTEQVGYIRIRYLAFHHLQKGKKRAEVASFLCVLPDTVSSWVSRLKKGLSNVADIPRSGAPSRLAKDQESDFVESIIQLQADRKGGSITAWDIQALLKNKYSAEYKKDSVYPLMKRLGMSWITARSKHPNQNEEEQEQFKKNFSES